MGLYPQVHLNVVGEQRGEERQLSPMNLLDTSPRITSHYFHLPTPERHTGLPPPTPEHHMKLPPPGPEAAPEREQRGEEQQLVSASLEWKPTGVRRS